MIENNISSVVAGLSRQISLLSYESEDRRIFKWAWTLTEFNFLHAFEASLLVGDELPSLYVNWFSYSGQFFGEKPEVLDWSSKLYRVFSQSKFSRNRPVVLLVFDNSEA